MHIDSIIKSLKEVTASTPELAVLLPGGLHHGVTAGLTSVRPFGQLDVMETGRVGSSARVALVNYQVTLRVYVTQRVGQAGSILRIFHRYWDRLRVLSAVPSEEGTMVLIYPQDSEIEETKAEELGKDVLVASTSWLIKMQEKQVSIA